MKKIGFFNGFWKLAALIAAVAVFTGCEQDVSSGSPGPRLEGTVTISETAQVNVELTADISGLEVPSETAPDLYQYVWQKKSAGKGAEWESINSVPEEGNPESCYTPVDEDIGYSIRVVVSGTGYKNSIASNETSPVTAGTSYIISGNLAHSPETLGGRTFQFTDFSAVKISLKAFEETETEEPGTTLSAARTATTAWIAAGDDVGKVTITGGRYKITGVPSGTYRLTAEDPTGLYDFVDNNVVVGDANITKNIDLKVFPGLKLTVRIKKDAYPTNKIYDKNFILPVKSGANRAGQVIDTVTVDLDVDWGDGLTGEINVPGGMVKPELAHIYTGAVGAAEEKDFVIRITGTCTSVADRNSVTPGKFGMGYNVQVPGNYAGVGTGDMSAVGNWHYNNKD